MHWVELGATLHMVLMFISCHWIILLSFYLFYYVECNCDSEIFCRGPILEKVQMSGIFADSKQFVDMPTSKSKAVVLRNFSALPANATNVQLREFVNENFHRPGFEMRIIIPRDWNDNPKFLQKFVDGKIKSFAETIHSKWKGLTRRFDQRKLCADCQASSLKLPYPFIVPGGRFREFYYWDSYWILEGLYVSEMCTTAGGMIENMLVMIDEIGFIPNGARTYYMNRSQPPLFTLMIKRYLKECVPIDEERKEFIKRILPLLEKEYNFWMKERLTEFSLPDHGNLTLNIYRTEHWIPRPEAFLEDRATASLPRFDTELKQQVLYQNIASAAESGWDFSGRWLIPKSNETSGLEDIQIIKIIPVDLNVFILENEIILKEFYEISGLSEEKVKFYQDQVIKREKSINIVLKLNSSNLEWRDFDLESMKPVDRSFYISDLAPFWFMKLGDDFSRKLLKDNENILFNYPGGIPVSEQLTGQQWDFPNVWAPIQQLFIAALLKIDDGAEGEYYDKALNISQRFINSVYCGYEIFGQIFEKYHAVNVGHPGGGGEYIVQEGFGWTNGVVLWILEKFGKKLTAPQNCSRFEKRNENTKQKKDFTNIQSESEYEKRESNFTSKNRLMTLALNVIFNIGLFFKMF